VRRPVRLAAIRKIIEGLVELDADLAQLAAAYEAHDTDAYRSDGPLPPRTSRALFNRRCARGDVPGALKVSGRGCGYWTVARIAWHASLPKRLAPPAPAVEHQQTDAERADAMICEAGFKLTRR
jgi:hypothetical protein